MGVRKSVKKYRTFGTILFLTLGCNIGIAYIFYNSVWGMILFVPEYQIIKRAYQSYQRRQAKVHFQKEFKEFLLCINNALQTGHSMENAFLDAEHELQLIFREESVMYREVREINRQVRLAVPVEVAFQRFAEKYPYDEVQTFAEIFSFGKRLGGNYTKNLRRTVQKLEEKMQLQQEIQTMTAEKRLELSVMAIMPLGILVYMRLGTGDFMAPLYGNAIGVVLMTAALLMYVGMIYLGIRIIRIDV